MTLRPRPDLRGETKSGKSDVAMAGTGEPNLSIVTPVFNGLAWIERCVDNVAHQGLDSVEHIVLDGASTDGTAELLENLDRRWPHLRVVSEPDRGQSDALNKGIDLARSETIGVLNVDDYYEPGVLPRVVSLLEGHPEPSVVVGNCNIRNEACEVENVNRPRRLRLWQLLLGAELVEFPVNPSAYFYHRSIHEIIGRYAVNEHLAMDLDFLLHAARVARLHYFDETWGNFCLTPSCKTFVSTTNRVSVPQREAVYSRHRAMLPPLQRCLISPIAAISESKLGNVLRFCWRRPDLASRRFGHRIRRPGCRD